MIADTKSAYDLWGVVGGSYQKKARPHAALGGIAASIVLMVERYVVVSTREHAIAEPAQAALSLQAQAPPERERRREPSHALRGLGNGLEANVVDVRELLVRRVLDDADPRPR